MRTLLLLLLAAAPLAAQFPLHWQPPAAEPPPGPIAWPEAAAHLPERALTIAAWVRVDAFPEWTGIFSALQDNGGFEQGVLLGLRRNRFTFGLAARDSGDADGTLTYLDAKTFAEPGRWTFVCATYDGTTMRLWIDGELQGESTEQNGNVWYPEALTVALNSYVDANETHPLQGRLGDVWLDGRAYPERQIAALLARSRADRPPAPARTVAWEGVRRLVDGELVGDSGRVRVATAQYVQPVGISYAWRARPVDVALSPDATLVAVKDNTGVGIFAAAPFAPRQRLAFPAGGGSMHGIAFSADGTRLWATTAQSALFEARRTGETWSWAREIALPGPDGNGASHATGIAEDAAHGRLWVCLSRDDALAEVDLERGEVVRRIPVGIAPFDVVLLPGGERAVVSNWGGRRPRDGERTAPSSGSDVLIDERGVACSGTVGLVELAAGAQITEVATGLHPADLVLDAAGDRVYVANANSDTVTVLRASTLDVVATLLARPSPDLPYGSATNALALTPDRLTLLAANGGNNALAVFRRPAADGDDWRLDGFVPTAWYPGGVAAGPGAVFVADTKGLGSRGDDTSKRSVYSYTGVASRIAWPPSDDLLADWSDRVRTDARAPAALRALQRSDAARTTPPVPVPARIGEPSVIRHVVYVIKENRTYDQVLGDLPQGNGDPALCIFPRRVTPNHHALAEQFVLLDNFYCNGVNSADGHSWATEGNVTDHLEKSFGGFTRSYTFGDDPLTYSSTGFVWDNVLLAGLSFRNYGEMDYAEPVPGDATFKQIFDDHVSGAGAIRFVKKIGVETVARHTCPDYPGWNMKIPDVLRADRFLAELATAEQSGDWYDFMIVYLPQDHTSGLTRGMPTPEAHVADNDLALGRIVEGISRSRFWSETCVFVVEDDPQNGFDHVDGHRSLCLVASPYARRGAVVSEFYNQTSVLHTMQRMLGLPAMNQLDAGSPLMTACFTSTYDATPYTAIEPDIPLDRLALAPEDAPPELRPLYAATAAQDFAGFDRADEDALNRVLWHAIRGAEARYPAELAGAHGTGLRALGLVLAASDDDD
ncbi:MAG: phosphoesterase [Planctomycetes bacterium]|nr:phosphoesterase [Planctomycetota bacterium]